MKFLYVAPEHVSGTLALFKSEHERRGDECRFVTFWHSRYGFPEDVCLHLPWMPDRAWVRSVRRITQPHEPSTTNESRSSANLFWKPNWPARALFGLRDSMLWPRIGAAIREFELASFDVIHLDGGLDFTRDARFARSMARQGRHVVCFYHGSDLRTRGMISAVDEVTSLRLTSEWDLLELDQRLRYLYLPFPTDAFAPREYRFHDPIRIGHAARNPFKGTPFVERAIRHLSATHRVELLLFRDLPHAVALQRKRECDIFVDQLTNEAGWGYGMSSVEALAMGMPVVTNIPPRMEERLGGHPFVLAGPNDIETVLRALIGDEARCRSLADAGRQWVQERHDVRAVGDCLYDYYRELGWLS